MQDERNEHYLQHAVSLKAHQQRHEPQQTNLNTTIPTQCHRDHRRWRPGLLWRLVGGCVLLVSTSWNLYYSVRICSNGAAGGPNNHLYATNLHHQDAEYPLPLTPSSYSYPQQARLRRESRRQQRKTNTTTISCRTICECFQQNVVPGYSDTSSNATAILDDVSKLFPPVPSMWWDHVHPNLNHFELWDIFGGATNGDTPTSSNNGWGEKLLGATGNQEIKEKRRQQQHLYREWLEKLFYTLNPHRLSKAWKSDPPPATVRAVHDILDRRFRYLQRKEESLVPTQTTTPTNTTTEKKRNPDGNEEEEAAPPLRIAVLGGSVTAGHDFAHNTAGINVPNPKQPNTKSKAWPKRLEALINKAILGANNNDKLVEIDNMAVSASTSDIGSMILEYHLFPEDYPPEGPDVVIWSFATNDYTANKRTTDVSLPDVQAFITKAQQLRCNNNKHGGAGGAAVLPMVILVDDLTLLPTELKRQKAFSSELAWLSRWNEVLGISIGSTLLDVALANPAESAFHLEWIRSKTKSTETKKKGNVKAGWDHLPRVHPGLGVHIGMSWIVAYEWLRIATDYCQGALLGNPWEEEGGDNPNLLLGDPTPRVPLPPYDGKLDAREVLPLWEAAADHQVDECATRKAGEARVQCSYAWVSNRLSKMGTRPHVQAWMEKILVNHTNSSWDGPHWKANGYATAGSASEDKVGWEASGANASFSIEHVNTLKDRPIKVITVVCMHSYGPKWAGSRLAMTIEKLERGMAAHERVAMEPQVATKIISTDQMVGFHNSRTSIFFPYKFDLKDQAVHPGEVLRIHFRLVGGTTFKILGLTFCAS